MLCVEASTRTCRVKLGHYVNFNFPGRMNLKSLGQYVVTEVEHIVNRNGHYENRLVAHPSNPVYVPAKETGSSRAYAETGVVVDNADPEGQGRVCVQFEWQQGKARTNWLRVQTPDAGSSDKVSTNRGFVVIPEIGDQVMVGYEHGNPSRPFVMGSLFHGKSGGGGGSGNNIKSLSSKSGHSVELNDGGGITIKDRSGGNLIVVDGENTITITSSKTITLSNGKSSIVLEEENIVMDAAKIAITGSELVSAGSGEAGFQLAKDGDIAAVSGKKVVASGSSEVQVQGNQASISGSKVSINGDGDMIITGGLVKINS